MVFKNVLFSHPSHIERMKRQKQLRCTTCHSQIVQGAHMTVTDVECFICHFYKTKDQKEYVTGCPTCHFEARGDIKVNEQFTFNHKRYIARGITASVVIRRWSQVTAISRSLPVFSVITRGRSLRRSTRLSSSTRIT